MKIMNTCRKYGAKLAFAAPLVLALRYQFIYYIRCGFVGRCYSFMRKESWQALQLAAASP